MVDLGANRRVGHLGKEQKLLVPVMDMAIKMVQINKEAGVGKTLLMAAVVLEAEEEGVAAEEETILEEVEVEEGDLLIEVSQAAGARKVKIIMDQDLLGDLVGKVLRKALGVKSHQVQVGKLINQKSTRDQDLLGGKLVGKVLRKVPGVR